MVCVFLDTVSSVFRLGYARSPNSMRDGLCAAYIKKYMQQNKSTHKILRGLETTYVHRAMLRCKDFHLSNSRFTISLIWDEAPSLPIALLET